MPLARGLPFVGRTKVRLEGRLMNTALFYWSRFDTIEHVRIILFELFGGEFL